VSASRAGIGEDTIFHVAESSTTDVSAYHRMLDISEAGFHNRRLFNTPAEVAGETVLKRVKGLVNHMEVTSKYLDEVVEGMPNFPQEFTKDREKVMVILKKSGIILGKDGKLRSTGAIPNSDLKLYKTALSFIEPNPSTGKVFRNPRKIHAMRQRLFNEFDLAGAKEDPFSDSAIRDIEEIRKVFMDSLSVFDRNYQTANKDLALTIGPLTKFVRSIQYKGNLKDIGEASLKSGEVASKVLGKRFARPMEILQDVEERAKAVGVKFDDDMYSQIIFADNLDDMFSRHRGRLQDANTRSQGRGDWATSSGVKRKGFSFIVEPSIEEQIKGLRALLKQFQ